MNIIYEMVVKKTIKLVKNLKNVFNSNYVVKKGIFKDRANLIEYNKVLNTIKEAILAIETKQGC